jgi:superfamily II DNA/RNA helicase
MTELQKQKYEEAKEGLINISEEESREVTNILAKLTVCQQIANSPALIGIEDTVSSKEEELIRLLENELQEQKVIVYTRFKSWVNRLEKILSKNFLILKITGSETEEQIEENKQKFLKDPQYKIIFITNAGSKALNLQSASTIIFLDTHYSYGEVIQLVGRAQRIGSDKQSILALHMVNCDVDKSILEILAKKKELYDNVYGDQAPDTFNFKEEDQLSDLKLLIQKLKKPDEKSPEESV